MGQKPFWDVEETIGFDTITASEDGMNYKVWDKGTSEIKQQVAEELAKIRRDLNKLLVYLYKNPQLWMDSPIAWGIIHTFDIHIPCLCENIDTMLKIKDVSPFINEKCSKMGKLFNIQEMTPNKHGLLGLNKPKEIINITSGSVKEYPMATRRSMFLTIRNKKMNTINNYKDTLLLSIHEITHTTCNDVIWKDDNHKRPYPEYHSFMQKCARECGILS